MDNGTILHTFKLREMFINFDVRTLKTPLAEVTKMFSRGKRREFAMVVFKLSLEAVIDDIIDNGVQFQFPIANGTQAWFCMQRISDLEYQKSRKNGAFKDFDPVDTNFCAYRVEYCMLKRSGALVRVPVHLDSKRTQKIAKLAKQHKLKVGPVKSYTDYYDVIREKCPALYQQDMYKILKFGYYSFSLHMSYGADIYTSSPTFLLQTGSIYTDQTSMLKYVMKKLKTKSRIMYRRLLYVWDGYCYFSLSKDRMDNIKDQLAEGNTIDFGEVMLHKCYDEAFACALGRAAMFKVKAGDENTRFANLEHLVTDQAQLIEVFHDWSWDTLSLSTRNFMTILPHTRSVQQIYRQNRKPYYNWLSAKRSKRTNG